MEKRYWPYPVLPPSLRTSLHQEQISFMERVEAEGLRAYSIGAGICFGAEASDGRSADIVLRGPRNSCWEVVLYTRSERVSSEMVPDFGIAAEMALCWFRAKDDKRGDIPRAN